MARRAAKVDANHGDMIDLLIDLGMSVYDASGCGEGFTDLVVGFGGVTVLAEVKDGQKVKSARKLTKPQVKFHSKFKGAITVIETPAHAIELARRIRQVAALIHPINWNIGGPNGCSTRTEEAQAEEEQGQVA